MQYEITFKFSLLTWCRYACFSQCRIFVKSCYHKIDVSLPCRYDFSHCFADAHFCTLLYCHSMVAQSAREQCASVRPRMAFCVVRKGEVLAYVVPSTAPIERANQSAQLAELRAAKSLADKRVTRLKELSDTVPRKDIEAAESEAASLAERMAAVGGGLATREALVAPVSGVIASAYVVAGQVVDARELLFEIIDPSRLRIEALAFEPSLAANVGSATLAVGDQRVPLEYLGAARSLREQALPLGFRAQGAALNSLAVGQPVRVFVQTKQKVKGIAVPVASLMKNPANQTVVWVKTAPERFEPRSITTEALDGVNVAVTSGLKAGDRIATQGATLINQVR